MPRSLRCKPILALLSFALLAFPLATRAQTITVRVLNGRNGKPLANKNVTFHWGETTQSTIVAVDRDGVGHVTIPPNTQQFILVEGPLSAAAPHSMSFEDCNATSSTPIAVADVVTHGVSPRNTCGTRNVPARPGEVVFWGRTRPWFDSSAP